jgi:hypothetical protein
VRGALERIPVPDDDAARERARTVVLAAFAAREPLARPRRAPLVALCAALVAVAGLAVGSPPGRAIVNRVREIVGVERAEPALFSLPGGGRLLVDAADGTWVVEANGKKRLLPGYWGASWSPFGRFVVAVRENELTALEPNGDVRWTLARRDVSFPRWTGTRTDTRIAYVDRTGVRVVAGDGDGDRLLARGASGPVAWRPGPGHVLAFVSGGAIRIEDADTGRSLLRRAHIVRRLHTEIEWSADGRRLLVVNDGTLRVIGSTGKLVARSDPSDGRVVAATFLPRSRRVVVARTTGGESAILDLASGRTLFRGTGVFDQVTPSSDGRWLAVEWRTADQWVFVRTNGRRAIRAFSGIASQFGGGEAVIAGWCCSG